MLASWTMDLHAFEARENHPLFCAVCSLPRTSRTHPHEFTAVGLAPGVCLCGAVRDHVVHQELIPA
jgi:hypothetical protein